MKRNSLLGGIDRDIDRILNRSSPAVCGIMEREVIVKSDDVSKIKQVLRKKGYIIIGTGEAGFGRKKIWFNPAGVGL